MAPDRADVTAQPALAFSLCAEFFDIQLAGVNSEMILGCESKYLLGY